MASTKQINIKAEVRSKRGKEWAKKARRTGKLPAVIYGVGGQSIAITLDEREFVAVHQATIGEQILIPVQLSNGQTEQVFVKELQREPISDRIIHVDLLRVDVTATVHLPIRLRIVGEKPLGVRDGGILERIHEQVQVEALPGKIPGHIDIDLTNLAIGQAFTVGQLPTLDGVKYLDDPAMPLYSVHTQAVEAEAAPAAAEAAQPEVIGKDKKEE